MAGNIKGVTIEIGGETSGLQNALKGVNDTSRNLQNELKSVEKLLKLDPTNTELLAQKQTLLTEAVENTKNKLDTLKEAERQVQQQFANGEVSEEQYRGLQREIIATEQNLRSLETAAQNVGNGLGDGASELSSDLERVGDSAEQAGNEAEKSGDGWEKLGSGMARAGEFALKTAAAVGTAVVGMGTAFLATAESTREYRTNMDKLETAFTTAGQGADEAKETYMALYSVLGDEGQATEATAFLAQLTTSQEDLSKWTDICTGVYATFGASLPIEGLTEAANETAKTGAVTGSLADALNWAGVSEDDFNASLEKCNTEQERATLITDTLNGLYDDSADKYKELNADVIAANEAQAKLTDTMAMLGEIAEPIMTELKNGASKFLEAVAPLAEQLLEALSPLIDKLLDFVASIIPKIQTALQWVLDNYTIIIAGIAGIAAGLLALNVASIIMGLVQAFKAFQLANEGATVAQWLLNAAMAANPIGIIIVAVTALTAAVVAAVAVLWNTNEDFRNGILEIWNNIKDFLKTAIEAIGKFFSDGFEAVKTTVSTDFEAIKTTVTTIFETVKTTINTAIEAIKKFFTDGFNAVKTTVDTVFQAIKATVDTVLKVISTVVSTYLQTVQGVFKTIMQAISGDWSGAWNTLKTTCSNLLGGISTVISTSLSGIKTVFSDLVGNAFNWGKNLISGFIDGIKSMISKVKETASSVTKAVSGYLGFNSPSKEGEGRFITDWGENMIGGFLDGVKNAIPDVSSVVGGATAAAGQALNGNAISNNYSGGNVTINMYNPQVASKSDVNNISKQLQRQITTQSRTLGFAQRG